MWAKILPYVAIIALGGLYVDAKQDLATAIERCNTDKQTAVAEAETLTRETLQDAHERKIAELARQAESKERALEIAAEELERATSGTAAHEQTINRLMLEASIDDIPDSKECLNVFVPRSSLDGLYMQPEDCRETDSDRSTGSNGICSSTEDIDHANPASGDFSEITFGDSLKGWGRDRATIGTLNGRLGAIESLGKEVE